jgi:hypothetical protein
VLFFSRGVMLRLLPVRLLFLIRTSRDYITRPLDASSLDIRSATPRLFFLS